MENKVMVNESSIGVINTGKINNINIVYSKSEETSKSEKTDSNKKVMTPNLAKSLKNLVVSGKVVALERELGKLGDCAIEIANKCNLLHKSIHYQQYGVLVMLLNRGLDKECINNSSDTPLLHAAYHLNLPAMEILVQQGANIRAATSLGISVLHRLIVGAGDPKRTGRESETIKALDWLLSLGLRPDVVNLNDTTLIQTAALALSPTLLRHLVNKYDLDVNAVSKDNHTALFRIIEGLKWWKVEEERGLHTAECLIKLGARTDTDTLYQGKTAGEYARSNGYWKLAALLGDPTARQRQRTRKASVVAGVAAAVTVVWTAAPYLIRLLYS